MNRGISAGLARIERVSEMSRYQHDQLEDAELFSPVRVSPRGQTRKCPMEVLILGHSRTGTATMATAMGLLGLPCYHGLLLFTTQNGDCEMWIEGLDRKYFGLRGPKYGREEFDQILANYGAVADQPALAFSEELIAAYPEAKVVLVERNVEDWYPSFKTIVADSHFDRVKLAIANMDKWMLRPMSQVIDRVVRGWMGSRTHAELCANARQHYHDHYALVRRVTPPERLVEFKFEDGWEPLCKALNRPIPQVPFPRVNERKWLEEKINLISRSRLHHLIRIARTVVLASAVAITASVWTFSYFRVSTWFKNIATR